MLIPPIFRALPPRKKRLARTHRPTKNQEKDATVEKLASAETLLETSQKNLVEAQTRCQSLEASIGDQEAAAAAAREDASERTSHAGERVSTLEGEACSLREEVMLFFCYHQYSSQQLACF